MSTRRPIAVRTGFGGSRQRLVVTRRHHVSAAHSKSLGELVQRIDADVSRPFGSPPRASPLGVRGRSSPWGSLIHIEAASVSGDLGSGSKRQGDNRVVFDRARLSACGNRGRGRPEPACYAVDSVSARGAKLSLCHRQLPRVSGGGREH